VGEPFIAMLLVVTNTLRSWFRPILVAIFSPSLRRQTRWRLLLLQPISLLTYTIVTVPWLISRPYKVEWLPIRPDTRVRVLIFKAKARSGQKSRLRPLHIDVHGGGFLGGLPESDALFCQKLAEQTGAVVFSTTYRYAPEHVFPAAIDDIDSVIQYLQQHAEYYGVDPKLLSVSGFSAGGTLALAASQQPNCHPPSATSIKASVTYYAPVRVRLMNVCRYS
jgi:acetyl esterase/lipase